MTNYERIKNMSVEEMAEVISKIDFYIRPPHNSLCQMCCAYTKNGRCNKFVDDGRGGCTDGIKQWLESEVTE